MIRKQVRPLTPTLSPVGERGIVCTWQEEEFQTAKLTPPPDGQRDFDTLLAATARTHRCDFATTPSAARPRKTKLGATAHGAISHRLRSADHFNVDDAPCLRPFQWRTDEVEDQYWLSISATVTMESSSSTTCRLEHPRACGRCGAASVLAFVLRSPRAAGDRARESSRG